MQIKNAKYLLPIVLLLLGCINKKLTPNATKITFTYECWDWSEDFNVTTDTTVKELVVDDNSRTGIQNNIIVTSKSLTDLTGIIYKNLKYSVPKNKLSLYCALRVQLYQEENVIMDYYLQDTSQNEGRIKNLIQDIESSEYGCENVLVIGNLRKYKWK